MTVKAIIAIFLLALMGIVSPRGSYTIKRDWVSTYTYQFNGNGNGNNAGIEYAKDYGYPTAHNLAGGIGKMSFGLVSVSTYRSCAVFYERGLMLVP